MGHSKVEEARRLPVSDQVATSNSLEHSLFSYIHSFSAVRWQKCLQWQLQETVLLQNYTF